MQIPTKSVFEKPSNERAHSHLRFRSVKGIDEGTPRRYPKLVIKSGTKKKRATSLSVSARPTEVPTDSA